MSTTTEQENTRFLRRCFDVARLAKNASTSPNPAVGAVIVAHEQRIIGEGFTQPFGGHHGEVMAVESVKTAEHILLPFSTMYVSLEPCFHFGKTPPCVNLVLDKKILKVVIAHLDPNPLVSGKSITKLMQNNANVQVLKRFFNPNDKLIRQNAQNSPNTEGVSQREQRLLENGKAATLVPFFTNMTKKRPFIILKWAESADGFISKKNQTTPISNAFSKRLVHKWRSEVDAIMVGTATAALDNPELTNRLYYGKTPVRVVLDRDLSLSKSLKIFDGTVKTLVFSESKIEDTSSDGVIQNHPVTPTQQSFDLPKNEENTEGPIFVQNDGVTQSQNDELTQSHPVITLPAIPIENVEHHFIPFDDTLLDTLLEKLLAQKIGILFVEGGEKLLSSFIERGLWDEARVFTASHTLGEGVAAPQLLNAALQQTIQLDTDTLRFYVPTKALADLL
jgi:diaminohydroxyphosphoribosylaminopyrimidine deaminase / 5-amino-6-(5-phosphoribosylamino)uracil reductase